MTRILVFMYLTVDWVVLNLGMTRLKGKIKGSGTCGLARPKEDLRLQAPKQLHTVAIPAIKKSVCRAIFSLI